MPENMRKTLAAWGYDFASEKAEPSEPKEAEPSEPKEYKPVDCTRDLQQVRELIGTSGGTITPEMLLVHHFLRLTEDARKYLEQLTTQS